MERIGRFVKDYPWVASTLGIGLAVFGLHLAEMPQAGRWVATIYVAAFVLVTAIDMIRDVLRGHFGLDILALVAMISTHAVGEYVAALIVVLMLSGGEALEDYAARRATRDLDALLTQTPRMAHRVLSGGEGRTLSERSHGEDPSAARIEDVDAEQIAVGDHLLVRPSEVVPVDGELLSEHGEFDESSLTGESLPVSKKAGQDVMSGSVNGQRAVLISATRAAKDSQFQQIVALVREAEKAKAPIVRLADRYAVPFTVVALAIAALAWALSGDPVRFAEVLVLATPCPLLIAAPVAFMGGQAQASRRGVIVKGGAVLEALSRVRTAVFDKTGTLTRGCPILVDVQPARDIEPTELLRLAASAEQYSSHVLAAGIREAAVAQGIRLASSQDAEEQATHGVRAVIEGRTVVVGKKAYIESETGPVPAPTLEAGQAAAYVSIDGTYAGVLLLADEARPEAAQAVHWLGEHRVQRIMMLTGDAEATAQHVATQLGIGEVHAGLLPRDKVRLAAEAQPRAVLMVGDGVNDAPVLASADVGIAMGVNGATAAGEAADGVVLRDSLRPVVEVVAVARHTVSVALVAIWIGIVMSVGLMLVATTGLIPAVVGALLQEVIDLAAILYALQALATPRSLRNLPGAQTVPSRREAARQVQAVGV